MTENGRARIVESDPLLKKKKKKSPETISADEYEFGGPWGAVGMMVGFPALMYYMWIGATFYDGKLPTPGPEENMASFLAHLGSLIYQHAFPHFSAWIIYWAFILFEAACYLYLPGVYGKGKRLPHLGGAQLEYYCSAVWSWYTTIVVVIALHLAGLFRLQTLVEDFGSLMSVAICSGFIVSIVAYVSARYRGAEHRMSGNVLYDFFMGAEQNPRLGKWLDLKMFCEIRPAWYMLFFITLGTCAKQYEQYGYVSNEALFLLLAHFLYANACAKGEELIITSWDIYFEKCGFMIIFWTWAGVPLTYCHCALYIANHDPSEYSWNPFVLGIWTVLYLFVYWVWDTCNSQKNMFRAQERGTVVDRKTFPQLPWKTVQNPEFIKTATGDSILCSGWYGQARKIHYTCDIFFALSWALATGWKSPFPWFYPVFFTIMILHRAYRDNLRCSEKYGEAWKEYTKRVPYLFIPYVV